MCKSPTKKKKKHGETSAQTSAPEGRGDFKKSQRAVFLVDQWHALGVCLKMLRNLQKMPKGAKGANMAIDTVRW